MTQPAATGRAGPDGSAVIVPWARQPSVPVSRKTGRVRLVVNTLPDWEPLPPGEILVRRPERE